MAQKKTPKAKPQMSPELLAYWMGSAGQSYVNAVESGNVVIVKAGK